MNLINLFHKTITEIGIKTFEQPIFYQVPAGIRFEIGSEEDVYIKKGLTRKLYPNPVYVNEAVKHNTGTVLALHGIERLITEDTDFLFINPLLKSLQR